MAKFHTLKVSDIKRETKDAVSIAFEVPIQLQPEYQFIQGQYITLKLKVNNEEIRRSYSLCSSPYSEKELRVAVKEVPGGKASVFLNKNLNAGDQIEVMTPMGSFYTSLSGSGKKNYILFAGGSGITPMMSILKSVLYIEKQSKVTLIYANRDEESAIFMQELQNLQSQNENSFNVIYVYDQPRQACDELYKGILTEAKTKAILEKHVTIAEANEYFICGPGAMMENVKKVLETTKVSKEKIHIEYFSAVADAVAKEENAASFTGNVKSKITVLQYGVATDFNLNTNGSTILEAAIEAGVDAPFSCKGAVCCTCRAKILEGNAKMDANFALTENEVKEGFILTCQAHPITERLVIDYDAI